MKRVAIVVLLAVSWGAAAMDLERDRLRVELYNSDQGISRDAGVVNEQKYYEFQTAKSVIDMHGNRVRVEQYLYRPADNQLRVDILNTREGRIDRAFHVDTYNTTLPENLIDILRHRHGNGIPRWYITDRIQQVENGAGDTVRHELHGGWAFKTAESPTGGYYDIVYNLDQVFVNNMEKTRLERVNHNPAANVLGYVDFWFPNETGQLTRCLNSTVNLLDPLWRNRLGAGYDTSVFPTITHSPTWLEVASRLIARNPLELRKTVRLTFKDGTWLEHEHAWINDDGRVLNTRDLFYAALEVKGGKDWRDIVTKWNEESIFRASEFAGRDIDLVWCNTQMLVAIADKAEGRGEGDSR